MKKLDHVVTNNINNKYRCNGSIEFEPEFDSKFSSSSGIKNPRTVVTVILQGGKKDRANIIADQNLYGIVDLPTALLKVNTLKLMGA